MPEPYIIHRFDHEGDGSTDLWWSQVCLLSDWERDIFEKIVCNQHFRTVNLAELPRDVRKVLSHYVGKSDQTKFSTEDESTQAVMKTMSYCLKLKEVDPPIVSAIGDMPMCVITV